MNWGQFLNKQKEFFKEILELYNYKRKLQKKLSKYFKN